MLGSYVYKFPLRNGKHVFVPSLVSRTNGADIHRELLRRWRPPSYFYHLRNGGHLAALKLHLPNRTFAMIDIGGFFDSITRSKIHRALREIGFDHHEAWEIACESTVEKTRRAKDFSLPYGFVQSPVLASLALDNSALGRRMKVLARSNHTRLTNYVDDIILSWVDVDAIEQSWLSLISSAKLSRFEINETKSQPPSPKITAFNVVLSNNAMAITEDRLREFEDAVLREEPLAVAAIIAYVRSANRSQAGLLARLASISLNATVRELATELAQGSTAA